MDFAHYQSPKLLSSSPPITQVSIFGALSISGQINRENLRQTCRDYPIYLGRSAKSKIPDRLGSSRLLKTRLNALHQTAVTATRNSHDGVTFYQNRVQSVVNFLCKLQLICYSSFKGKNSK